MTPEQQALAKALVAHSRWRWVEGMTACPWGDDRTERIFILPNAKGEELPCWGANEKRWYDLTPASIPDLSDYATASILIRMAQEALASLVALTPGSTGPALSWGNDNCGERAAYALLSAWGPTASADTRSLEGE